MRRFRLWTKHWCERRLPKAEARLSDLRAARARKRRFEATFGGRAQAILDLDKRIARQEQQVAKLRAAVKPAPPTEGEG